VKKALPVLAMSAFAVLVVYLWLPILLDTWNKKHPESHAYYGDRSSPVTESTEDIRMGVTVLTGDTEKEFSVQPKNLKMGDVLKITLPNVHPKCLAIETPGGRWLILSDPESRTDALKNPIDLTKTNEIELPVNEQEGVYYDPKTGERKIARVFAKSGKYRLWFVDNLETEIENTYFLNEDVYFNKK